MSYYYLSARPFESWIDVRRYSDGVVVHSYNIKLPYQAFKLTGLTSELFLLSNASDHGHKDAHRVYSFDCFDPNSLVYRYDAEFELTQYRLTVGSDIVIMTDRASDDAITFVAYKFTKTNFTLLDKWSLPVKWYCSEVFRLSDNQFLTTCRSHCNKAMCSISHITTIDADDKFTTVAVPVSDLHQLATPLIDHSTIMPNGRVIHYPKNRLWILYNSDTIVVCGHASSTDPIRIDARSQMKSVIFAIGNIVDGKISLRGMTNNCTLDVATLKITERKGNGSIFYAYPSKQRTEQTYLPMLLPVFKGCRDLALLVVSYLEWNNDIVN